MIFREPQYIDAKSYSHRILRVLRRCSEIKVRSRQLFFLLFLLCVGTAFAQQKAGKQLESQGSHGKTLWQFDTKG